MVRFLVRLRHIGCGAGRQESIYRLASALDDWKADIKLQAKNRKYMPLPPYTNRGVVNT